MVYGIKSKDLKRLYEKSCVLEDEYSWRIASLIVILSLGIFAFTTSTPIVDRNYLLEISWYSLGGAFFFGCLKMYAIRKPLSRLNQRLASMVHRENIKRGNKYINAIFTNTHFAIFVYIMMVLSFTSVIIFFVIYYITLIPNPTN